MAIDASDADLVEVTIPAGTALDGMLLRESPPPDGARITIIRRDGESVIPSGSTKLGTGAVLLLVASRGCDIAGIEQWTRNLVASDQVT